jgi:hypothetical protein
MWLEKLSWGVLRVLTPLGPRYVKPSLAQRFYLLWIFRNFHTSGEGPESETTKVDRWHLRHARVRVPI